MHVFVDSFRPQSLFSLTRSPPSISLLSYWIGSSAMQGNQLYQYRVILPIDDDKTVNVATDLDFNVEGEVKWGLTPNVLLKSNFAVSTGLMGLFSWYKCG
jgi:hypothetical protein